ncbi:MAG: alkaline phosphatase family protein [Muribaculum sp.]|nr:alkaline phosphatase family protein [Muribaculaceae bacterium]MCM1080609.1 alkaline phosphatase family protein [Muribaculum sp.]
MRQKKDRFLTAKITSILIASMVTFTVVAQSPSPRPKLVVGIVVDGLREDYIDLLKGYFGPDGFNRLITNGVMMDNVDFGTQLDATAATALLYTGSEPAVNGIPSGSIYEPATKRHESVLNDPSATGNYTESTLSPKALRVSTLSDEVRIDGGGIGSVYSVSPDAAQSIIMAGHAGNSAFWIDDTNGKWATTTYYKDVPPPMSARNFSRPLASRLDTLTWRPTMAPEKYPDLPAYKKYYPFRHMFQRNDLDRFANYKTSAPVNTEVTDIASDYIKGLQLGTHQATDMLNVAYTLAPFSKAKDADSRLETLDSYLKLDVDLARLFSVIDKNVGLDNTFIFLSGTPAAPNTKRDDDKWGIPNGEFNPRHAVSLLNMYLMAKHGQGEWVTGIDRGQLYLNHELIKEKGVDLKDMREESAEFLVRMTGVSGAWTIEDIVAGRAGANSEALKRNTTVDLAGDILLDVNPGWEIVEVDAASHKETRTTVRAGLMAAPVFIMHPSLVAQRISDAVDARSIAPTVARILRIRSPNAAKLPPMRLQTAQKH